MKSVFFKNFDLVVYDNVYEPAEDSFLLAENVKARPNTEAIDVGCGCGIQAINLALQGANVIAVDISMHAVRNTIENARRCGLENKINAFCGNLLSAIRDKKFDCITFNPPYLPVAGPRDEALDGGLHGYEILHKFLDSVPNHLKSKGACYFVQSSLSNEGLTKRKLKELGLSFEIVAREHLFFEELIVFKAFL